MESNETEQATVDEILSVKDAEEDDDEDVSKIIKNPEYLEIDNVPEADRIVGRDEQLTTLANNLKSMRTNDSLTDHILEWGETGTGKTLVAKHVSERLEALTADTDDPIVTAYLNPDPNSTYTQTFRSIASQVNEKAENPVSVPDVGISAQLYREKKLYPIVEEEFSGGLVVVIDELEKHPDINEILYTLSRAKSKDGVDVPVVVVGISNDADFKGDIEGRVQSTLQPKHLTFTPYDEGQLVDILEKRRDAFYDGVLEEGVIPKTAENSAQEHGDARRAVRMLRNAGELAVEDGADRITLDHVEEADELVEVELFMDLIEGTRLAGKLILFAITRLKQNNPDRDWFRTSEIHETYQTIARDCEVEPKGYNRTLQLLNKQVTTSVLESEKVEGGELGNYRQYSLQPDVGSTRRGLLNSTPELQELMGW